MNQKNHENEKQYEIYWNEKRRTVPTIRLKQLPAFYGNTAEVTSLAELSSFSLSLLIPLP